ncbi:MAG: LPXTG cell wall anchor domain-containing protein [Candidatus Woesearchaeota archaeon]
MKKIIILIIFILIIPLTKASIAILKEIPSEVILGDEVTVTISLRNDGVNTKQLFITEMNDFFSENTEGNIPVFDDLPPDVFALPPSTIEWNLILEPSEAKQIFYSFYPRNTGIFFIQETIIRYNDKEIRSEMLEFNVECNNNGICEPDLFENEDNCPHDCSPEETTTTIPQTTTTTLQQTQKETNNNLIYIIGFSTIIILISFLVYRKKNKKEEKEDYSEILNRLKK